MGYYEPRWSAEEQTMIDVIKLSGCGVMPDIDRKSTTITLHYPDANRPLTFVADTEYEAIRKAFNFWSKNNAQAI